MKKWHTDLSEIKNSARQMFPKIIVSQKFVVPQTVSVHHTVKEPTLVLYKVIMPLFVSHTAIVPTHTNSDSVSATISNVALFRHYTVLVQHMLWDTNVPRTIPPSCRLPALPQILTVSMFWVKTEKII